MITKLIVHFSDDDEVLPGKHFPHPAIPRSFPRPNMERLRRARHWWSNLAVPDDDDVDAEPKDELIGVAISIIGTLLQVLLLTPWYMTKRDNKLYVAFWKSHYYIPHLFVLALLFPTSPVLNLIFGIIVGNILGRLGIAFSMAATHAVDGYLGTDFVRQTREMYGERQIEAERSQMDASDAPDSKFVCPDGGLSDFDADEPVATLDKNRTVMAFGVTQSGKTSNIKTLISQLQYDNTTAVVAHGSGNDYTQFYRDKVGVEVDTINLRGGSVRWNLFREIPPDMPEWEVETVCDSIAYTLIPKSDKENPHFPESARIVLSAILQVLHREHDDPHHGHLHDLIMEFDRQDSDYDSKPEAVKEWLNSHGENGAANKIQPGEKGDAWGTLHRNMKQNLKGDFAKPGEFSFREYMRNPNGRIVSIETDEEVDVGREMISVALDRANKQAFDENLGTTTYFIYDELAKIGHIGNLLDLTVRGLKQGSRMICGVQTKKQLDDVYGEDTADAICENMRQYLCFQAGASTAEFIQGELGETDEVTESVSRGSGGDLSRTQSETRRCPIPSSTLSSLDTKQGECVVIDSNKNYWQLYWMHPDQAVPKMLKERGSVPARSRSSRSAGPSASTEAETEAATASGDSGSWSGDGSR
jgi:type IV secretory pathway TraG/TraD family ATPase VirD4